MALLAAFAALAITGCAGYPKGAPVQQNSPDWSLADSAALQLSPSQARVLEAAQPGERIALADSGGQGGRVVRVTDRFFAATGRQCLAVRVEEGSAPGQDLNLCRQARDRWTVTHSFRLQRQPGGML